MDFTTSEMNVLTKLMDYLDKLDKGCQAGEVDNDLLDKAQEAVNTTHRLLGDKSEDQGAYVIYEAQSIIHWIKEEVNDAYDLIISSSSIKGDNNLHTETGCGILEQALLTGRGVSHGTEVPVDKSLVTRNLNPGALLILSIIFLYFGGVSGGAIGAGLGATGLICFITSLTGFIRKMISYSKEG